MKKHLLKTMLVATGLLTSAVLYPIKLEAQTKKILCSEDYEKATSADWTAPNGSISLVTGDATYGKYVSLKPIGSGNRSAYKNVTYSSDPTGYTNIETTEEGYTIEFDLCIQSGNTINRSNSQFIITTATSPNLAVNNLYSGTEYIFALSQPQRSANSVDEVWYINDLNQVGDKTVTLSRSKWYHYTLSVTNTGTSYKIAQGSSTIAEGKLAATYTTLPKISGFFTLLGRGSGYVYFDNLDIYEYAKGEVAQVPTITLKKVNGKERVYNISYTEGETLHYQLPEATEFVEVSSGNTIDVSTSTSGTLSAYTTKGSATSSTITSEVDAKEITLNAPTYTLSGIGKGYNKTYTINIDNSDILLSPSATLSCKFTPAGGEASGQISVIQNGGTIKATEAGTYEITAFADGYTEKTITIENNTAYAISKSYKFSEMTKEDFSDATLWAEGTDSEARWGWSKTPATKFELQNIEENATKAFDGIELFTNKTPTIYIGYGLMAPGTTSNYGNIKLANGKENQYASYTYLNNYGKSTLTTVQKANEIYSLFRFSDILKEINIYTPVEIATITSAEYATYVTTSAVKVPENVKVLTVKANTTGIETAELAAGTVIPAGTAVVLNAEAGDYTLELADEAGTKPADNDLTPATADITADGTQYCLTQNKGGKVGFAKVKAGVNIPAGKAYLVVSDAAAANFFALDGSTTAIKNVETAQTADNAYYTLQGVKVERPAKGIYIKNGKKVVIK